MKNGPYELIVPPPEYPGKRYRGRYAYEHRVNWWMSTGKNPDDFPKHVVHHDDEEKRNNRPTNLEMLSVSAHAAHHKRPITMVGYVCLNCGDYFERQAKGEEHRVKFCSRQCIGYYCGRGRPMDR